MPPDKMIRVMLLDDHLLMLHGLQACLNAQTDIQILGSFNNSHSLLAALQHQQVDVVLLDYALGPEEIDGLNLVRGLKARYPKVRLLVVSALHNPATVSMVMRCGADGFIGKETDPTLLPVATRCVASGKSFLAEEMSQKLQDQDLTPPSDRPHTLRNNCENILTYNAALTVREHEVLRCCLEGMSVTKIAEKFSRSIKTISTQKQSAFKKLGVRSDNELYKIRDQLVGH